MGEKKRKKKGSRKEKEYRQEKNKVSTVVKNRDEQDSHPVPFSLRNEFPFPSRTWGIDMKNNGNEK